MKTSELTCHALNWAVARAKGIPAEELKLPRYKGDGLWRWLRDEDGELNGTYMTGPDLLFCTKWEAGGPIIECEKLMVMPHVVRGWMAFTAATSTGPSEHQAWGETPLIAAMRCYVTSKLGEDIELPKELQ
jgi:hypothetical protein